MASSSKPLFTQTRKHRIGHFNPVNYAFSIDGSLVGVDASNVNSIRVYSPDAFDKDDIEQKEEKEERAEIPKGPAYKAIRSPDYCFRLYKLPTTNRVFCRNFSDVHLIIDPKNPENVFKIKIQPSLSYSTFTPWKDKIAHVISDDTPGQKGNHQVELFKINFTQSEAYLTFATRCAIPAYYGKVISAAALPNDQLAVGFDNGTVVFLEEHKNVLIIKKAILRKTMSAQNFLFIPMPDNFLAIIAFQSDHMADIKFFQLQSDNQWQCIKHVIGFFPGISDTAFAYDDCTLVICEDETRQINVYDLQALLHQNTITCAITSIESDICALLEKNDKLFVKSNTHLRTLELTTEALSLRKKHIIYTTLLETLSPDTAMLVVGYVNPPVTSYAQAFFAPCLALKFKEYEEPQLAEQDKSSEAGCCPIM